MLYFAKGKSSTQKPDALFVSIATSFVKSEMSSLITYIRHDQVGCGGGTVCREV